MAATSTSAELASKTLKTLIARKLAPTPRNYAQVYAEVGGDVTEPPGRTNEAIPGGDQRPALAWAAMIRDLVRQLETHHKGITLSRKKDGLDTVLVRFGHQPDLLYEKLQGLLRSWGGAAIPGADEPTPVPGTARADGRIEPVIAAPSPGLPAAPEGAIVNSADRELLASLSDLLAHTLESNRILQPELSGEIDSLAAQVRAARNNEQVTEVAKKLRHFWVKMELRGGDRIKIQEGLLGLLRLLVENVGELVEDDKWLHGQIALLQEIISQPLDNHSISSAERSLREALVKQSSLKKSLADAKDTLKSLMTTFIDRMGEMTESASEYHNKMERYNNKIGQADNLTELGHILEDIMQDTRVIQTSTLRTHEELVVARRQADEAEQKVRVLEQELEQVSELVSEDQLTGALNRRGMEEVMNREVTRSERTETPLAVGLLDIDNFKLFNDLLGHQAGDQALMHVTQMTRGVLRPTDSVARYGGEEFLVILPGSGIDAAVEVLGRVQNTLTQKQFVYNREEIVITFSAGVAVRQPNETVEALIKRADQAMYQAKAAGKNRIVKAP